MQIQRLSQLLNRLQNIRLLHLHRPASIRASRRYARSRCAVERLEDRRLLTFVAAANVSASFFPSSVATGDFNGDGKLDLAIANRGSRNVSVRLGNGLGGFSGTSNFSVGSTGSAPSSVTVGDFNGDGKLDFVTANSGTNNVSVRLGNGLGGFTIAPDVPVGTGSSPSSVAVGDFNGDGKLDFATANSGTNSVSVRRGDGLGGFAGTTTIPVGTSPSCMVMGDFNGDGKLDLATANRGSNNVSVRLGNGLGSFTGTTTVPVGPAPSSVAVGDFNGDGKLDFATANSDHRWVSVQLGNGLGGFTSAPNAFLDFSQDAVTVGDFNGDGKLDLATVQSFTNILSVLLGDGLGGFSGTSKFEVGSSPSFVTVGDFNGDGRPDLATANSGTNSVSVLLNNYPIRVNLSVSTSTGTEAGTTAITVTATAATPVPSDQTVNLAVTGTGITTGDYTLTDGDAAAGIQIKILSGQTTGTVTYTIVDDLENEGDETATLTISSPSTGLTLGTTLSQNITITDNDTNAAPTAVVLSPSSVILAENANTSSAIELSTISITDDGTGTNTLSLSGADAASFEIVAGKLYLIAGVALDYETKQSYSVVVNVDDATVGNTPDASAAFTLNISNVAELTGFDVQKGQTQRSFIRNVDILFDSDAGLADLLSGNRVKLTRMDLNGLNPTVMTLPTSAVSGNQIQLDFGSQGIGGNRSSNAGDGYYQIAIDTDGDGSFESIKHFFRLYGDVTGDGLVDSQDKAQVLAMSGTTNVEGDLNGDGLVNLTDTVAVSRAVGRKLKSGLTWDD